MTEEILFGSDFLLLELASLQTFNCREYVSPDYVPVFKPTINEVVVIATILLERSQS